MDKDNQESAVLRRKRQLQEWGASPLTQEVLSLLRRRYQALPPYQTAPTWERQHQAAGEQKVMYDLTRLAEKGEL